MKAFVSDDGNTGGMRIYEIARQRCALEDAAAFRMQEKAGYRPVSVPEELVSAPLSKS